MTSQRETETMNPKLQRILHPIATRRAARVEKFLQAESLEYQGVIDTKRPALDEKIQRLKVAHNAKFAVSNVSAPGVLESTLLPVRLDYLRSLMQARVDIRKRLGQECPNLLLAERLDKLEEDMIRTVDHFRLALDGDYKRRVAASGIPEPRSLYRDDAEYGDVVAFIRREVKHLKLGHELGRGKNARKWTRADKIAAWGVGAAIVIGIITAILAVTVPEVRRWVGLDKPASTHKVEGAAKK
jgi:hypothetical protein